MGDTPASKPAAPPPAGDASSSVPTGGEALQRGAASLRQTEQQLEFALHAGRMGSWEFDIAQGVFRISAYCRVVFGLGPDDPFETARDLEAVILPEDRQRRRDAVNAAIASGGELEVEYRTRRPNGEIGWVLARGRAAYENGEAVMLAGISQDITERKAAEARQQLLIHELNHRVKNTLTTVQSVALQTFGAGETGSAGEAFVARLSALAAAHDLLSETAWDGALLDDVARQTLAPFVGDVSRVEIAGPAVRLAPNAAVSMSMAFHELATNATKYGALSSPEGRVDLGWRAERDAVMLDWREAGGPTVAAPTRRGFGSRLIERGLAVELGSEAAFSFLPEGLACAIRLPLSDKVSLEG
jgi:two-component sensor histidine kinase